MRILSSGNPHLIAFDEWTVRIGDGLTEKSLGTDLVEMPEEMCIEITESSKNNQKAEMESMKVLAEKVYPNIGKNHQKIGWMDGRAILAPTNKKVTDINNLISESFPGKPVVLTT